MKKVDYIIVGQGIAGSVLASTLLSRDRSVMVIDTPKGNSSSLVAAGICNPLVLKRFTKGWMADITWPLANKFYHELEEKLGASFFHPIKIARLFSSVGEQNDWQARLNDETFTAYLKDETGLSVESENVHQPLGYGVVTGAAQLNAADLITAVRTLLLESEAYSEAAFTITDVALQGDLIRWNEFEASKLIFCDGIASMHNEIFAPLPFAPTKGDILKLHIPGLDVSEMIHAGIFLLPQGEDMYLCGSTYNRDDIDTIPSGKGRTYLQEQLEKFLKLPYEIVEHKAGIRPTTRDRRPFVGIHPNKPQIGILNGLGSRGSILAPWLATMLANHLVDGVALDKEVDISKYY